MGLSVRSTPLLVIASPEGRLANRLFLFANFLGTAIEHNLPLMNCAFAEYAADFPSAANDLLVHYPHDPLFFEQPGVTQLTSLWAATLERFPELSSQFPADLLRNPAELNKMTAPAVRDFFSILTAEMCQAPENLGSQVRVIRSSDIGGSTFLDSSAFQDLLNSDVRLILFDGWSFRDGPNLGKHRQQIRDWLEPHREILASAEAVAREARTRGSLLIGVHIRHTDYQSFRGGKYFYPIGTYVSQMRAVTNLFPEPISFLVCSDVPQREEDFAEFRVTFGPGTPIADLHALSLCDKLMGPPSTFTMWASYLRQAELYSIEDPKTVPTSANFWPIRYDP